VEQAIEDHDELLVIAARLRDAVRGPVAPQAAHSLLRIFHEALERHREREVSGLYEQLLRYAKSRSSEFSSMLEGMLTKASFDWVPYLSHWTRERIETEWSKFGEETWEVLDRGLARLCLENEILYPLALKRGLIPLRTSEGLTTGGS